MCESNSRRRGGRAPSLRLAYPSPKGDVGTWYFTAGDTPVAKAPGDTGAARPLASDRLCYAKTRDGRWTIVNFDQGQDED
jgi:hypothetical protein